MLTDNGVYAGLMCALSRWAPGTMNMVSEALITQVVRQKPRLAPLSWDGKSMYNMAMYPPEGIAWCANKVFSSNLHIDEFNTK